MAILRSIPGSSGAIRAWRALAAALLVLVAAAPAARSQGLLDNLRNAAGGAGPAAQSVESERSLAERQADTQSRLEDTDARLARAESESAEPTALIAQLRLERDILARIQLRQRQIAGAQADIDRLAIEGENLRQARDAFLGTQGLETGDTSFEGLERQRDELDDLREKAATLQREEVEAKRQLRDSEEQLVRAQRNQLRVAGELSQTRDAGGQAAARQLLRLRELETEERQEQRSAKALELERAGLRRQNHDLVLQQGVERVRRLAERARFLEDDFQRITDDLAARSEALARLREAATREVDSLNSEHDRVEREASRSPEALEENKKELEYYSFALDLAGTREQLLDRRANRINVLSEAWSQRHQLAQGEVDAATCADWAKKTASRLEDLAYDDENRVDNQAVRRQQFQAAEQRLLELGTSAGQFDIQRKEDLQGMVALYEEAIQDIRAARRILLRLQSEIAAESRHLTLGQRFGVVRTWVGDAWGYPLIILGPDKAVEVRHVILGLTILVLGSWVSRRSSRLFVGWMGRRFKIEEGGLAVAETLSFYALIVLCVLLALKVVNVPLTAFTIFGGAIAIGVGFGSQNLINNFISGLILLMERPVRVGDLIQVGELQGNVERIGARSTIVRTGSNIEIVVPNSSFIEQNVINWTLTESRARVFVRVGVAYGSPTRDVAKLLKRAVDEHGRILKSPDPIVLFEDFGDNALIFEVHFWIRMRTVMDRRNIESDVRFIVDGLFRDAGISIAYPQRDLHLDTLRPMEVRVLRESAEPADNGSKQADAAVRGAEAASS